MIEAALVALFAGVFVLALRCRSLDAEAEYWRRCFEAERAAHADSCRHLDRPVRYVLGGRARGWYFDDDPRFDRAVDN